MARLAGLAGPVRRALGPVLQRLAGPPPPPAVVYTMGKVGSSAVTRGLRRAGLVVHHIHTLDRATLMRMAREALDADRLPLRHVATAMAWRGALMADPRAYRFVTLVRDPFARTLSAFFENLGHRRDGLGADSDPARLWQVYLAETDQIRALTWFEREFRAHLGIDIMARPFDPAARHADLAEERTLVFRVDCPDAVKARVLSRAFGRRIGIGVRNLGADKPYAAAYAAVRAQAVFPRALAEEVYGSAFVRHFWTAAERAEMMERWTGGAGAGQRERQA
jgi:hypothetical protein